MNDCTLILKGQHMINNTFQPHGSLCQLRECVRRHTIKSPTMRFSQNGHPTDKGFHVEIMSLYHVLSILNVFTIFLETSSLLKGDNHLCFR